MTTAAEVIRAVIPGANEDVCDHILWGRTPFPCGAVSAKALYRAAAGYRRACANKLTLCEMCDRRADANEFACKACWAATHSTAAA